ncbi:Glycosyl hydrolases family 2, sugar binding domain [Pirellulimonas nuda]|uniref:Glycosyl hydrolases family 2, sugar binding domain n=1 Tax=Pirellulimonas nuda TaxID=2528009 RepID=A0A518DBT2_9BACT|nr:glycosyl hydrolase [Pirellulimonas nuda]QDU88947.1 Glycosyl hydrolases family 2, sugar binding domain [Pirellulimonas nuda]
MTKVFPILASFAFALASTAHAETLEAGFAHPPQQRRPETWFHLISGNVNKAALTVDLEAVASAGMQGIQLFHGAGSPWPGVSPQIETLSPAWDDMIAHVANEARRLGLRFTMQNCPGWAMSGGPWITPGNAMRHIIWSREVVEGGSRVALDLAMPQPSREAWRDYRDIAVLAFPTPADDDREWLTPVEVRSNRSELAWADLIRGKRQSSVRVEPADEPAWVEVAFAEPTHLRSISLPPVELLMARRNFDPDSRIRVQALVDSHWKDLTTREIPRGTWQDRQPEHPLVLAIADTRALKFRIVFENKHPIELTELRFSSAARVNDWQGQAAFALRSQDRSPPPVQDTAAWVRVDSIVDLSDRLDATGRLSWPAPPGGWTVLRFGHVNTGAKNKPAPPEATGFECDKLSPGGAEQHFAGYIGRISANGGPADGGRLGGMLIDSWECYTQTWTPAMEAEFARRRGYPLRAWLPGLAGYVLDDHRTSERFLRDWRKTISDLLVENYFGRLAELARGRGMMLSFETALGDVSPGDILQYFGKADIPMCEFWQPNDPHQGGLETKPVYPAASAAHIYGKPTVAAEAFTNVGHDWDNHFFEFKHLADAHFALGINHLVFHTYTHNPLDRVPGTSFGGRIGSPFIRGQTWWRLMPHFTDYLARCQYMLQQGHPVADVLWCLGDDVDHKPRQDSPFPAGYKFDYVNQDVLLHRLRVVDGVVQSPEGLTWRVLWLPPQQCGRLTAATLRRLEELLRDGAVVVGGPPELDPSLSEGGDFDTLRAALWGDRPATAGDRTVGSGRLIWGGGLEDSLRRLGVAPDVTGAGNAVWIHRRVGDTEIYFVAASRDSILDTNLCFRAVGTPEFWDPLTGAVTPASVFKQAGDKTILPIQLPAAGSRFVVFRPGAVAPAFTKVERDGQALVETSAPGQQNRTTPERPFGLRPGQPLQPWIELPYPEFELLDRGQRLLAWENGDYKLTRSDGRSFSHRVTGARSMGLSNPWKLSFPGGWDTLGEVELPRPAPWSELGDAASRAFSGTATYRTSVTLGPLSPDARLLLDLGRVANVAEVSVNGRYVATLWAPPFRAEITPAVKEGENLIEIRVTNTWHNRLVYDASLPADRRRTWTLDGPGADSPTIDAGLLGPATIRVGSVHENRPGT